MNRATHRPRHGGILLEVLLSIALFVGAASFALGATRTVLGALDRSRRQALAVDIARSKLAELDAGIVTLADLRDDADAVATVGSIDAFGDDDTGAERWSIAVQTERTEFDGLLLVALTVTEVRDDDAVPRGATCTLRQLVSMRRADPEAFETDDLLRDLPGVEEAP